MVLLDPAVNPLAQEFSPIFVILCSLIVISVSNAVLTWQCVGQSYTSI